MTTHVCPSHNQGQTNSKSFEVLMIVHIDHTLQENGKLSGTGSLHVRFKPCILLFCKLCNLFVTKGMTEVDSVCTTLIRAPPGPSGNVHRTLINEWWYLVQQGTLFFWRSFVQNICCLEPFWWGSISKRTCTMITELLTDSSTTTKLSTSSSSDLSRCSLLYTSLEK